MQCRKKQNLNQIFKLTQTVLNLIVHNSPFEIFVKFDLMLFRLLPFNKGKKNHFLLKKSNGNG